VLACPFGVPKYVAEYDQMMKCDMCYDRTSVGLKPMCASVCPSEALWFGTPEEFAATRSGTLVNEWWFGSQYVATKVRTVSHQRGAIDVLAAAGARPWQDDPFGLEEMGAP
jgi:Fe-S-cluster-containing dehydrogenase component